MLSVMIGSTAFKLLSHKYTVESLMRPVLFVSALALLVPVFFEGNQLYIYSAFLVFEFCVGIFWPAMCTMRGKYVPEETRSTVMNFFRWGISAEIVRESILVSEQSTYLNLSAYFRLAFPFNSDKKHHIFLSFQDSS